MARQYRNGVLIGASLLIHRDQLRLSRLQLRLRRRQIAVAGRPGVQLILRDFNDAPIQGNRLCQQGPQGIGGPQIEVIRGQGGLRGQLRVGQIRLAHLHTGLAALYLTPDRAPNVGLPGDGGFEREFGARGASLAAAYRARHRRRAAAAPAALHAAADGNRRIKLRLGLLQQRDRLLVLSLVLLDVLIGNIDLAFQLNEFWVIVYRPPRPSILAVLRRAGLPDRGIRRQLLVRNRTRRIRPPIVGADLAGT